MSDDRFKSRPVTPTMVRCTVVACRRWWNRDHLGQPTTCACGGSLAEVDMAAHMATLPTAKKGDVR